MAVGLDRGVALPLAGSDGQQFDFLPVQGKRLASQEKHKKRWQKRQARRIKGSKNWVKAKRKVARYQRYGADVRRDVAHKTSHALAADIYLGYKARRQGKLVIEVPAFYSSQECGSCGHIHQDNRVSQSEFVCQSCGHTDHADHNAAKVIAGRGAKQLLAGKGVKKEKKTCRITRQKVGAEGSEPGAEMRPTLGETAVSRLGGNTLALWSLTQETPAIALA